MYRLPVADACTDRFLIVHSFPLLHIVLVSVVRFVVVCCPPCYFLCVCVCSCLFADNNVHHLRLRQQNQKVDQYFERETVDTSTIDTLAEVLPLGTLSDAAAVTAALARTAAAAAELAPLGEAITPLPPPPYAAALGVGEEEGGDGEGGVVGAAVPGAILTVPGLEATGPDEIAQLPGQRALLRLRKKCDAGAGE